MTAFSNPVPGVIRPKGWVRPAGNVEFAVTRTCADHQATKQGCALDLGNRRCGDPVLGAKAGTVVFWQALNGIIRILHANGWRTDYSHMSGVLVKVGDSVADQQRIGSVGSVHDPAISNFAGCHLHFNTVDPAGQQQDPYPLLRQNGAIDDEEDDVNLSGTFIEHISNKQTATTTNSRFREKVLAQADPTLVIVPKGTAFRPVIATAGWSAGGVTPTTWYGGWLSTAAGWQFGYFHSSILDPLTSFESTGVPQAKYDADLKAARQSGINDAAKSAAATT